MNRKNLLYRNSLSIVFIILFLSAMLAQAFFGWKEYASTLREAGIRSVSIYEYLRTGHFIEATFENFQSEFLQMALYVASS